MFYECYNAATGAVGRPRAWGSKVGDEYKAELLSSGWSQRVCSEEEEQEHEDKSQARKGENGQEIIDEVVKKDLNRCLPVNGMLGSGENRRRSSPTPILRGRIDFVSRYA